MKSKQYVCVECGKTFEATQPAKYCSAACRIKHVNHAKATFQCVYCGKQFIGTKNQKPRFCSQTCVIACRKEILENPDSPLTKYMTVKRERTEYERICSVCGEKFKTFSATYVNRQCPNCQKTYGHRWYQAQKEWNRKALKVSEQELDLMLKAQCIDDVVVGEPRTSVSKAQSPIHVNQTREEENARRRRVYAKKKALGLLTPSVGPKTRNRLAFIRAHGSKCCACGYDYCIDALAIHHKDMNRQNNSDDNCVVLCSNCHAILHTRIKSKWASYGENKTAGILEELEKLMAEVKSRNKAGTPERVTRTEG